MLMRSLVILAVAAVAAVQVPSLLQWYQHNATTSEPPAVPAPAIANASTGSRVTLRADERGHFNGTFKINGKPIDGLIDTGATYVAINESTARRLGFSGNGLNFKYVVNTANGQTKAAHVTLDRVEIGGIRVRSVDAAVLKDNALSSTLVGMSFLKKLGSYRSEKGALHLVQ